MATVERERIGCLHTHVKVTNVVGINGSGFFSSSGIVTCQDELDNLFHIYTSRKL